MEENCAEKTGVFHKITPILCESSIDEWMGLAYNKTNLKSLSG